MLKEPLQNNYNQTKPDEIIDIYLKIGDFFWGNRNYRITTILGSCVSICIWHPKLKIGGICHYLLPGKREKKRGKLNPKYGDDTMWLFLDMIKKHKTEPKDYIVKIFGGSRLAIFNSKNNSKNNILNPGQNNLDAALERIKKYGFIIRSKHIGGDKSRKIIFELWNGNVWMKRFKT